jgi:hypothetical protein
LSKGSATVINYVNKFTLKRNRYETISNHMKYLQSFKCDGLVWFMLFNAIFSNISSLLQSCMDSLSLKKITHYHNTSDRINMVSAIQLLLIVNGASYVTFIRDRRGRGFVLFVYTYIVVRDPTIKSEVEGTQ